MIRIWNECWWERQHSEEEMESIAWAWTILI